MITNTQSGQDANAVETESRGPAAKWAILLNDELFPMPRRKLVARDILDQCGVTRDFVLQRDHGDTRDVIFADDKEVDLTQGNVFRTTPRCKSTGAQRPDEPAKLAFVLDDHWELT